MTRIDRVAEHGGICTPYVSCLDRSMPVRMNLTEGIEDEPGTPEQG